MSVEGTLAEGVARLDAVPSLEELAYRYGTDKSKDDHKYVDLYMTLFDPIRFQVRNVAELGVATGQSLQMWHDYFSNARVWGFDVKIHNTVRRVISSNKRISLCITNVYNKQLNLHKQLGWANDTVDVIIDDAWHERRQNEDALVKFWPFVRPGGFYVIEDVGPPSGNMPPLRGEPTAWNERHLTDPVARRIVYENTAFIADTSFGHRNWSFYANTTAMGAAIPFHAHGRYEHTSHVIVLRKRTPAHSARPWRQFYGQQGGAMMREWIYEGRSKWGWAPSPPPASSRP